jgi:hypothetical protein
MGAALDLFNLLFEPTAVFERVREKPRFWQPYLVVAIIVVTVQVLMLPYSKAALAPMYQQMAQQNPAAAEAAQKFAFVGVIAWPIVLAILLLLNALVLWVLVSVVGGEGKFSLLLSVATYTSVTFALVQIISLLVLVVKGKEGLTSPEDLQPAIGLDLLISGGGRFLTAFLKTVNPLSIWGVVLTAIGIGTTHRLSKGSAYTVAILGFLIAALIGATLAATCAPRTS